MYPMPVSQKANLPAIALNLNIVESAIVEVQEWAKVLWVRFKGGCRFVSKNVGIKKMTKITPELFCKAINKIPGFSASIWKKHGLERVYLNKINGEKSFAYLEIGILGDLKMGKNYCPLSLEQLLEKAQAVDLTSEEVATPISSAKSHSTYLSGNEGWKAYHRDHPQEDYYFGAADEESF